MRTALLLRSLGLGLVSLACSSEQPTGSARVAMPTAGAAGSGTTLPSAGGAASAGAAGSGGATSSVSGLGGVTGPGGFGGQGGNAVSGNAGAVSSAGSAQAGTTAGGASGPGALDPALPPGRNFNLEQFALQLPVASGNSVQQIKPVGDYSSEYFYTGDDGAMTLWCPVTGATTPNSHYPRTELRELPALGDWDIGGIHRLRAQLKMLQSPPSKGTIIGQIHGNATDGTSEVLKLEWTTENQIIASVEANDNPAQQINHTMGSYKLGELVSYELELKDSVLTVTVSDQNADKTFTTPYTAASWTNDKYYFKLGTYVQLDTGPVTSGGRVAFYSFSIEHG